MECVFYPDRGNTSWTWIEPGTNNTREDLPACLRKCKTDPLTRSDLRRNWTEMVKNLLMKMFNFQATFVSFFKQKSMCSTTTLGTPK